MWTTEGTLSHTGTPREWFHWKQASFRTMAHSLLLDDVSVQENYSILNVIANLQLCVVSFSCHPRGQYVRSRMWSLPHSSWAEGHDRPRGRWFTEPITDATVHQPAASSARTRGPLPFFPLFISSKCGTSLHSSWVCRRPVLSAWTHLCRPPRTPAAALHPPRLQKVRSLLRSPRMQEGPPLPQLSRGFQPYLPLLAPQRPTPVTDIAGWWFRFENSQPSEQLAGYRLELSLAACAFCSCQLLASGDLEHLP